MSHKRQEQNVLHELQLNVVGNVCEWRRQGERGMFGGHVQVVPMHGWIGQYNGGFVADAHWNIDILTLRQAISA